MQATAPPEIPHATQQHKIGSLRISVQVQQLFRAHPSWNHTRQINSATLFKTRLASPPHILTQIHRICYIIQPTILLQVVAHYPPPVLLTDGPAANTEKWQLH